MCYEDPNGKFSERWLGVYINFLELDRKKTISEEERKELMQLLDLGLINEKMIEVIKNKIKNYQSRITRDYIT